MSISFTKYVDITSGVGGNAPVRQRDLIGRIFTTNPLAPVGGFLEFDSAAAVGTYFGTDSEEYARASFYFGWISPLITRARRISFARWADVAVAPMVFGVAGPKSLTALQAITSGSLTVTLGGNTNVVDGLSLASATSFADVATAIQTALRLETGSQFTNASVSYDAVAQRFILTGGVAEDAAVGVSPASPLAGLLGWGLGAIESQGSADQSVADTLIESANGSNNFGSFAFMADLTTADIVAAAQWNAAQNVLFQFMVPVTAENAAEVAAAVIGIAGTALTLAPAGSFDEMIPMIILAATDFSRRNGTMNYMFRAFATSPKVQTDELSDLLDGLRVNYYGRTQTAGQFIDFYQRGVLMGGPNDPVDMNVYGNEQWLKDNAASRLLSLLLSLGRVSANVTGRTQVINTVQSTVDDALFNGVISVGKLLNTTQKLYVTEITGDPDAWRQVETIGYWIDCVIEELVTPDGRTEYKAVYLLVYSKDDAIRKVEGTHTLV